MGVLITFPDVVNRSSSSCNETSPTRVWRPTRILKETTIGVESLLPTNSMHAIESLIPPHVRPPLHDSPTPWLGSHTATLSAQDPAPSWFVSTLTQLELSNMMPGPMPVSDSPSFETISTKTLIPPTTLPGSLQTSTLQASYTSLSLSNAGNPTLSTTLLASDTLPSTATPEPTEFGTTQCEKDPLCEGEALIEEDRRGVIAGSVVGSVGAAVLLFAIFMFIRRKGWNKKRENGSGKRWKTDTQTTGSTQLPKQDLETAQVNHTERQTNAISQSTTRGRNSSLGEPGPALFDRAGNRMLNRSLEANSLSTTGDYTVPPPYRLSVTTIGSDPFHTPAEVNGSFDGSHETSDDRPSHSQIGLALTPYSTTNSAPRNDLVQRLSVPSSSQHPAESQHKRTSSLSAQTDVTDIDKENEPRTLFIGTAKPTKLPNVRRHSLTPRIVNIVAGSGSRDRMQSDGAGSDRSDNDDTESCPKPGKRRTTRARSSSPMKGSTLYGGSPAKLNSHFGIQTLNLGREPGRTSSELQGHSRGSSKDSMHGRGRTLQRKSSNDDDGSISYPPSSYPLSERTMGETKPRS